MDDEAFNLLLYNICSLADVEESGQKGELPTEDVDDFFTCFVTALDKIFEKQQFTEQQKLNLESEFGEISNDKLKQINNRIDISESLKGCITNAIQIQPEIKKDYDDIE